MTGAARRSGALVRLPNAITRPSLVPTYTRPLPVAGIVNLLAVPIGADQIGRSAHGRAQRSRGKIGRASCRERV